MGGQHLQKLLLKALTLSSPFSRAVGAVPWAVEHCSSTKAVVYASPFSLLFLSVPPSCQFLFRAGTQHLCSLFLHAFVPVLGLESR